MQLVLPMYSAHPYFSLKNLGNKVCTIHDKIWKFSIPRGGALALVLLKASQLILMCI